MNDMCGDIISGVDPPQPIPGVSPLGLPPAKFHPAFQAESHCAPAGQRISAGGDRSAVTPGISGVTSNAAPWRGAGYYWRGRRGVVYRVVEGLQQGGNTFGSRVPGTSKPFSDLDLAVIGKTQLDFRQLAALNDAFAESNLPFRVDVVDWAASGEAFRGILEEALEVVVDRDLQ
ncbi:MAG: nucleotidyltransferase domain-containing protein [Geobacteraceae bacterium]|nr:nucleotidyltransferase domain-containing protein [Geobacteraceae bacterium]